jgi:hypothetical protein
LWKPETGHTTYGEVPEILAWAHKSNPSVSSVVYLALKPGIGWSVPPESGSLRRQPGTMSGLPSRGCSYIMWTPVTAELLLKMAPAWTLERSPIRVCLLYLSVYICWVWLPQSTCRATTVLSAASTLNCSRCTWPFATAWARVILRWSFSHSISGTANAH